MKDKKKRTGILLGAVVLLGVVIVAIILSGSKSRELKKKLDLGQQYLSELNYEQAVIAFKQILEENPYQTEAYLGLAQAYAGMEDYEQARLVLEEGIRLLTESGKGDVNALQTKLDEVLAKLDELAKEKKEISTEEAEAEAQAEAESPEEEADVIKLQPLVAGLDDVWGKSWLDWTVEDYVSTFGLQEGSDQEEKSKYEWNKWYSDLDMRTKHFSGNRYATVMKGNDFEYIELHYQREVVSPAPNEEYYSESLEWQVNHNSGRELARRYFMDIDILGHTSQRNQIQQFFDDNQLTSMDDILQMFGATRDNSSLILKSDIGAITLSFKTASEGSEEILRAESGQIIILFTCKQEKNGPAMRVSFEHKYK